MNEIETWFYGRNSTTNQILSQEQQRTECEKYAKIHKMRIVEYYYDDGISGTTTKRDNWQKMIEKMKKTQGVIVLTYSIDRISRNVKDSIEIEELFSEYNCQLISITQPNFSDDSPSAILARNLNYSVNQYHSDNTKALVRRALNQKAQRCEFNGGYPCYGYKIVDKHYVIDENEAPAIKIIFEMISQGHSYAEVAERLTSLGYVRRNGQPFNYRTCFNDIIRNERYKSNYIWGRTKKSKRSGNYNYHQSRPREEMTIIENAIPRIVSDELWQLANDSLDLRKKNRTNRDDGQIYLLTSKIYCRCGKRFYGNSRLSGVKNKLGEKSLYVSYRCNAKDKLLEKDCHAKEIKRDDIDGYILQLMKWYLKKKNSLEFIQLVMNEVLASIDGNRNTKIKQLKNRIGGLTKQINNLVDSLALGISASAESIVSRIETLEKEKASLQTQLDSISMNQETVELKQITKEEIKELLDQALTLIENQDPHLTKMIVQKFISRVTVDTNEVQVEYNLDFFMQGFSHYARLYTVILRSELKKAFKPTLITLELFHENNVYFLNPIHVTLSKQKKTTHVSTRVVRGLLGATDGDRTHE